MIKTEFVKDEIPAPLLEVPPYSHPKAESNADVVAAYVILYSFYNDLKEKLILIKQRQDGFLRTENE